jgi:hypothetical protein
MMIFKGHLKKRENEYAKVRVCVALIRPTINRCFSFSLSIKINSIDFRKNIKKPLKLSAVYNIAPQCSKYNKVASQITKMYKKMPLIFCIPIILLTNKMIK